MSSLARALGVVSLLVFAAACAGQITADGASGDVSSAVTSAVTPIPESIFIASGGLYFTNGKGRACPLPYDLAIAWGIDLTKAGLPYYPSIAELGLGLDGVCSGGAPAIAVSYFLTGDGSLYFSNGAGHACQFQNVPATLKLAGLPMYPSFPSDLIANDGVCNGGQAPNEYPATNKPLPSTYFVTQGGIYFTNGEGHACETPYDMAIDTGWNMSAQPLPYFPSLAQAGLVNDGLCGGGTRTIPQSIFITANGSVYYSNGAGHACSFPFAGGVDTTKAAIYPSFPSDLIDDDGACAASPYADVKSFGAKGDGVTNDTAAIQAALSSGKSVYFPPGVYLSGYLTLEKPINIVGAQATILEAPGVYPALYHFRMDAGATGSQICGLVFDGNQMAMSASQGSRGVFMDAPQVTFTNVSVRNYASVGASIYAPYFSATNSHFDGNANLGVEIILTNNATFSSCSFDENGWGFQKKPIPYSQPTVGEAFGMAIRYQSYDITITDSEAVNNGKDGLNVNQGSHDVTYTNTVTKGNGDGGFTIAGDTDPNFTAGTHGEGQSPYNLQYTNCTSYNNISSGIASYVPSTNVQVTGGRFYDNGRVSGDQPPQDSFNKGIFFADGSKQVKITGAQVFDDRQSATVTSVNGNGVFGVKGWITGTIDDYAKVVVYSAQGTIRGYAWLRAETQKSVTIAPTSYVSNPNHITVANEVGVQLAQIEVGDTISQALQNIGVFMSNDSTGSVKVSGFGLHPAYQGVATGVTTHPGVWPGLDLVFSGGTTNIPAVTGANETSTAATNGVCPVSSCTLY